MALYSLNACHSGVSSGLWLCTSVGLEDNKRLMFVKYPTRSIIKVNEEVRCILVCSCKSDDNNIYSVISHINCMVARRPDKHWLPHDMCIYQVMMTLNFLNDVANAAEPTQKSITTS